MWVIIIICNVGIAIVCWRVVFWMLRFRLAVAHFRQTIVTAEENCRSGLVSVPESLEIAQVKLIQFRQWQRHGKSQWLLLRQWWKILVWGQRIMGIQAQIQSKQSQIF